MDKKGLHCFISGKVQGIFYRAHTQRKARELNITGWTRNLLDGRVEVFAFGIPEQLEELEKWLWEGPSSAKVDSVESEFIPWQSFTDFSIR